MRPSRSTRILVVALVTGACGGEPVEFADWTIPIPEGAPVVEYADVTDEERAGNELELERDLVIGGSGRPEELFYEAGQLAVDDDGRIYVLDAGNHRVQVFDADGELVLSFGNEGEGPGEFQRPAGIDVAGDRVVVSDRENARISEFTLAGEHLADHPADPRELPSTFLRMPDGTLLVHKYPRIPLGRELPEQPMWTASRRTVGNEELLRYLELPLYLPPYSTLELGGGRRSFSSVPMPAPMPRAALGRDGRVYASATDRYQVLALDEEAQALWALRVAAPVTAPTDEHVERVMEIMQERNELITRSTITWPEQYPAISGLFLDGAGRLHVMPFRYRSPPADGADAGPFPVDVYSPEGERIFAGTIAIEDWRTAHDDHVYRLETSESGDQIVVRYRIVSDL